MVRGRKVGWIDKRRVKHRLVLLFTTFRFRGYRCREHVVGLLFKWIHSTKCTLQVNLKTEEYIYICISFSRDLKDSSLNYFLWKLSDHSTKPLYKYKMLLYQYLNYFITLANVLALPFLLYRHVFLLRRDRVPLLLKGVDTVRRRY